jgi:FkbM family methyltransferase
MNLKDLAHSALAPFVYTDRATVLPYKLHFLWPERQFLRRFLKRLAIDCVWDVGANVGQYGAELRLLDYRGLIISFEPDPANFEKLKARSKKDSKWLAMNVALGRSPGKLDLNIMKKSEYNSFLQPSDLENAIDAHGNSVVNTVPTVMETVGRLYSEFEQKYGYQRVHLKMDTQGFDLEVFAGAENVHDRLTSIQSEVALKRIYQGAPKWTDALAVYERAGFEIAGLFAVNPHRTSLSEMDCFMHRAAANL